MGAMDFNAVAKAIQEHFTDGLVLVIGSGLSAAEGMPGMMELAKHLKDESHELQGEDVSLWSSIKDVLDEGKGLETALLTHAPSESLEAWIVRKTCELLIPYERKIVGEAVNKTRLLRLTKLLKRILIPPSGIPILTPNYDRLIEVACESAEIHVDTTTIGHYAGRFDPDRSCMASCRGIQNRGKVAVLDHYPRALVLKPHGSLDWYRNASEVIRSVMDLDSVKAIITPGLNKYKAGYDIPFDKHRELANNKIDGAARFFVVGYGFNDDHLQARLLSRIRAGVPTLILTRTPGDIERDLWTNAPSCTCVFRDGDDGTTRFSSKLGDITATDNRYWDLGVFAEAFLQ